MEHREPIDAEIVPEPRARRRPAAQPAGEQAPFILELHAWPEQLRARAAITEHGRRRSLAVDGSLLALLLQLLRGAR
jgi:hypothetical protein